MEELANFYYHPYAAIFSPGFHFRGGHSFLHTKNFCHDYPTNIWNNRIWFSHISYQYHGNDFQIPPYHPLMFIVFNTCQHFFFQNFVWQWLFNHTNTVDSWDRNRYLSVMQNFKLILDFGGIYKMSPVLSIVFEVQDSH